MGIDFKINNSLKNIDKGFVKVNNTLKQIDKGWTRINGVLKEFYSSFPLPIIAGDTEAGYCGKETGFLTQTQLENLTNFRQGNSYNVGDITWLRFAYKNKLLYIADRGIRYSLVQDDFRASGIHPNGKIITVNGKNYNCRLMTGGNVPADKDNEWDKLIVQFTPSNSDSNWNNRGTITQNNNPNIPSQFVVRGLSSVDRFLYISTADTTNVWRPCLELIE